MGVALNAAIGGRKVPVVVEEANVDDINREQESEDSEDGEENDDEKV